MAIIRCSMMVRHALLCSDGSVWQTSGTPYADPYMEVVRVLLAELAEMENWSMDDQIRRRSTGAGETRPSLRCRDKRRSLPDRHGMSVRVLKPDLS